MDRMLHCWSVMVGRSISRFLTVRWVNRGRVNLVASLYVVRGPDVVMLGQSVTASRYVGCMLHCWSVEVEIGVGSLVV